MVVEGALNELITVKHLAYHLPYCIVSNDT